MRTVSARATGGPRPTGLAGYRAVIASADAVLARTWTRHLPGGRKSVFGDWRLGTAREVVLPVITETDCHAGHLDAARELTDGRTWLVLD